jgi:predicted PolB exonuclease-like 3'-5' exonuclease
MIDLTKKKILVFDLEVVPYDFETHYDEHTKEYLLKYASTPEEKKYVLDNLVFNSFTSKLIAIGMLDLSDNKGAVLVNAPEGVILTSQYEEINYRVYEEKRMVELFWDTLKEKNYDLFVTFNGREFDCPYIMLKSFELGIRPSRNLMRGTDFNIKDYHIDLLKELGFNKHSAVGARRKFSLDFYCRQLGITSPKANGVAGDQVAQLYENKEYQVIADYCFGDVKAEAELFIKWNELLNFY